MPTMADITIKAADGTTNVVYSALSPSAGDTVPAQWGVLTGNIPAFRPRLKMTTKDNAQKTSRVVNVDFLYPVTGTVNGVLTQLGSVPFNSYTALPTGLDAAQVKEACYQAGNLLTSALLRAAFDSGFAPT